MVTTSATSATSTANRNYSLFLLLVAGLGGLLYGIDVGIIGGALPYLQATSGYSPSQLSAIVAAVLLGSVISTLFAGLLADWMGRKPLMILSGVCFAISIPIIALSPEYFYLYSGRLLQGISGGLIGVVVPLYLAECLPASNRGKGTGVFQLMLVFGLVVAALVGIYYSYRVAAVSLTGDASVIFQFKSEAWRRIFWVSLPPGILFVLGGFFVTESPRWLYRRGKKEQALTALLRSRTPDQASMEISEMEEAINVSRAQITPGSKMKSSLLRRKYVIPFVLACVILSCNTATGINSIIPYNASILMQSGLSDLYAHWGFVIFNSVNLVMTMVGVMLVDRKGRKFLLTVGTTGIILSLVTVGVLFLRTEKIAIDAVSQVQSLVTPDQTLTLHFDKAEAAKLLSAAGAEGAGIHPERSSFAIIYAYGDFTAATNYVRSDDAAAEPLEITRASAVPDNKVEAFFQNPFADFKAAQTAPLRIIKAPLDEVPNAQHGWIVAVFLYLFMSFYAIGPGVCVWLALSELMPTRIRSNGMSIALLLNQLVSTTLAGIFLPFVSKYGYSSMFFLFAGFTVIYFTVAAFFLPETKGKTLEEIEAHFEGRAA